MPETLIIKIGGSTLGSHDTLEDLVALQREGKSLVVIHGGGATITQWLAIHNVPSRFVRGLRATDSETLDIVVAVLAGLINKDLVASLNALGGRAIGISGADASLLRCRLNDPDLGFVGEVESVNTDFLNELLANDRIPVIAPIGVLIEGDQTSKQLVNINADTAAGEIAAALGAHALVFLTDVPGILGATKQRIEHLSRDQAGVLKAEGVIAGGMIPKVEACLRANSAGVLASIIDGREPHNLLAIAKGDGIGTLVG